MQNLNAHLGALRRRADISTAEVQRRLIRRGLSLNGSTVSRWFVVRHDTCTPSPGQLHLLLDVLGASDPERLETLRIAGESVLRDEADASLAS